MGFTEEQAKNALDTTNGSYEDAMSMLLDMENKTKEEEIKG